MQKKCNDSIVPAKRDLVHSLLVSSDFIPLSFLPIFTNG